MAPARDAWRSVHPSAPPRNFPQAIRSGTDDTPAPDGEHPVWL